MNIKLANERNAKHYSEGMTLFLPGNQVTIQRPQRCRLATTVLYLETLH